jgi:hypothetical protein
VLIYNLFSHFLGLNYSYAHTNDALDYDVQIYKDGEGGDFHIEQQYFDAFSIFSDFPDIHARAENDGSSNTMHTEEARAFVDEEYSIAPMHIGGLKPATEGYSDDFLEAAVSCEGECLKRDPLTKESKDEAMKKGIEKGNSKVISVILNCLESLPVLPASASDMTSPKSSVKAVGSISVMASTVDLRSVTIKCACANKYKDSNKVGSSSCIVPCCNGSSFQSLSYRGSSKMKSSEAVGIFSLALVCVFWLFFWFLVAGGLWKLVGGVYRFCLSV